MVKKKITFIVLLLGATVFFTNSLLQSKKTKSMILLTTSMGNMEVVLYDETPAHRDNMLKLVAEGFYTDLLFHRVIADFMIQTGDPQSKGASQGKMLGDGGPGYTVPAEFHPHLIHKRGALAAARLGDQQNPRKASSGSQFYIVQGRTYSEEELKMIENQRIEKKTYELISAYIQKSENTELRNEIIALERSRNREEFQKKIEEVKQMLKSDIAELEKYRYSPEHISIYTTIGGTPFLDYEYSVFGEVVSGLEIIENISKVPTKQDRPVTDVTITITKK